jgi:hypothetical protein
MPGMLALARSTADRAAETLDDVRDSPLSEGLDDMGLAALLEGARTLRRHVNDLCTYVGGAALEVGVEPRTLDWRDPG